MHRRSGRHPTRAVVTLPCSISTLTRFGRRSPRQVPVPLRSRARNVQPASSTTHLASSSSRPTTVLARIGLAESPQLLALGLRASTRSSHTHHAVELPGGRPYFRNSAPRAFVGTEVAHHGIASPLNTRAVRRTVRRVRCWRPAILRARTGPRCRVNARQARPASCDRPTALCPPTS